MFRRSFGVSDLPQVFDYASMPSLELSARSQVLTASQRLGHYRTGQSLLALPCHGSRKKEPPPADGRFEALVTCHLEGLRVREGGA